MKEKEPEKHFLRRIIDARLNDIAQRRIEEYTRSFAVDEHGKKDEDFAYIIRREVLRRSSMGRELDVYEPFRWTMFSFALSTLASIGFKLAVGEKIDRGIIKHIFATTALSSGIGLLRLESRWEAGLKGGLDTAFSMAELERSRLENDHSITR